jgi:ribose transport system permease protein
MEEETTKPSVTSGPATSEGDIRIMKRLRPREPRTGGVSFAGRYGLSVFLVAMVVAFSISSPTIFFTSATFVNIMQSNSVLALVALGVMMPLVVGEFDLTVGATVGLGAIFFSELYRHGPPFALCLILTMALGCVVGLVNAFCVNILRVSSLITTLGFSSIIMGFTAFLTGGQTVTVGIPTSLVLFAQSKWLGVPRLLYIVVASALVIWFLLSYTPLGREFYAVGMNRDSSRLMGSRVKRDIVIAFAVSGCLAALSGVFELGLQQSVAPSVGNDLLLPALAVAFLGASTIRPGWFNVWGMMIGVLVLQSGIVGLDDVGAPYWLQPIFDGVVLISAVAISSLAFPSLRGLLRRFLRRPDENAQYSGSRR